MIIQKVNMTTINLKVVTDNLGLMAEKSNDRIVELTNDVEKCLALEKIFNEFKAFSTDKLKKNKEKVFKI